AAAGIALRFERDGARLYVENMHAVVRVTALQLEETFSQAEQFVELLARTELSRTSDEVDLRNLLSEVTSALRQQGAMATLALRDDKTVVDLADQLSVDEGALLREARAACPAQPGKLCISHVFDALGRHLVVVSSRHDNDADNEHNVYAVIINWERVGRRITQETRLDAWSKGFVLDGDGTLLAWPDDTKLPGFKAVDTEAGCAQCHHDQGSELGMSWNDQTRIATISIQQRAHLVATEPVPVGGGRMFVGMVAPRSAALGRIGPVLRWGLPLLLALVVLLAFIVYRLHRLGTSQVRAFAEINQAVRQLNEELEHKVAARTALLEQANAREQELLRQHSTLDRLSAVGELAAAFAHEVRTPLNALSIAAQRLGRLARRDEGIDPAAAEEILQSQQGAVQMINGYVENYLAFTRKARAVVHDEVLVTDLRLLAREVFGYVRPEAERNGVELHAHDVPEDLRFRLDQGKLRHVLVNLVLNAVQAQPGGGSVLVRAQCVDEALIIDVHDRGPGIPEDTVATIFEPFMSYREGGTGLGLAICHRLAQEDGASIVYLPGDDGGATFRVTWPVRA
ncbi:MAG: ATP-binding protein, partial [Pseudomonadota bacterium]